MASVAEATATLVKNIEAATGRKIAAWVQLARATGYAKHGAILGWLKSEHGMGHSYANYIAKAALTPDNTDDESLVAAQYAGKKSALKPLYDALIHTLSIRCRIWSLDMSGGLIPSFAELGANRCRA